MGSEELTQALKQLHNELTNSHQLDEKAVKLLRSMLDDINIAIENSASSHESTNANSAGSDSAHKEPNSIGDRLRDLINAFEAEHPKLTSSLSQVADFLAEIGI